MSLHRKTYFIIAAVLWSTVGILFGITTGVIFYVSPRTFVFLVAAGVGIVWLIIVNFFGQYRDSTMKLLTAPTSSIAPPLSVTQDSERLQPEEARRWLDDFLSKQQDV